MTLRLLIPLLTLLGCATPRPTATPLNTWTVTPDLQVAQIHPDVYVHTSWNTYQGTRYPANGLLVRDGDGLLLIDTAWGVEPTEDLLAWVRKELRLPIRAAVATHHHADRLGGAEILQREGIPVKVHPLTRKHSEGEPWPLPDTLGGFATGDVARLGPIEVYYPGPAHTEDNVVVWIPAARLLFGGCAIKDATAADLGNIAEADLPAWPAAMRRLQERYPNARTIIPGHGDPGGPNLITHTLTLLARHSPPAQP